ncbi:Ulp1 peptidase [Ranunculus cassubicifolius]
MPIHEIRRRPLAGYVHTPHHLHIDLRVLDAVYALCTMLLEFPISEVAKMEQVTSLKLTTHLSRKKSIGTKALGAGKFSQTVICDYLRKVEQSQNDFEEIFHAIQTLRAGDSKETIKIVERLVLWGLIKEGDKLLELIKMKIETLTFLTKELHHLNVDEYYFDDAWLLTEDVYTTTFKELTQRLAFFALEHETIFEGSNYNFPEKSLPHDSSSVSGGLAHVASSLVWDETLSIPLHVLLLFLRGV